MMVTVHAFKRQYASIQDVQSVPPYKMTEADIRLDQSYTIGGTAEEVDVSALDWLGRYYRTSR